jgi:thiamine pyrophosphate-dependent acetolactate synthase large subunit-like protein
VDKFCPGAKVIHVDVDPASISKTVMADIPIVGPVQSVLTELLAQIELIPGSLVEADRRVAGGSRPLDRAPVCRE